MRGRTKDEKSKSVKKTDFEKIDARFDKVDRSISDLTEMTSGFINTAGNRFDLIDQKFDSVDQKFNSLDQKINETRETLARAIEEVSLRLAAYAAAVRDDYERLTNRVSELEKRIFTLETGRRRKA